MGMDATRDVIPGQVAVQLPDGREFAVVKGRRWTRVFEYLSNGQLTARWFVDEATGEAREAEGARKPKRWPMAPGAQEFARSVVQLAREREDPPPVRRDVLSVGRRLTEPYGEQIDRVIRGLEWHSEPSAPMMPGMAINAAIRELKIPHVSAFAVNGWFTVPDGAETATYGVYGIEGNYRDARVRLYVADTGVEIVPLLVDVWDREATAA